MWVEGTGRWRAYQAGQFIYHAGDAPDGIYGLASGSIQITFPVLAETPAVIHRAEVGFWIGDLAELAEIPRLVSVMATTESRLLHLPSRAISALLAESSKHLPSFCRLNALNVQRLLMVLSEALALTVRARLCRLLLKLSENDQHVEITQDELATLLGITRPTAARCLADLKERGGISMQYRKMRVLNPAVLAAFRDEQ